MIFFEMILGGIIKNKLIKYQDNNVYLVFPKNHGCITYYGLLYADAICDELSSDKLVLIADDAKIVECSKKMIKTKNTCHLLNEFEMKAFLHNLTYNCDLMGQSAVKNLFYISDCFPFGNSLKIFIDNKVFNEKYFVWNRIYHFKSFYYAKKIDDVCLYEDEYKILTANVD